MRSLFALSLILLISATSGCASMDNVDDEADPRDPFESYNRSVHNFNQGFDRAIAKPVAQTYQDVMPSWADKGITNFFGNLGDVIVLTNDLLQFKFQQAASDTARIFFNSTAGLLGFIDVASHMELPKHNEDFGQTLGYWGMPSGPYFVLPVLGPSSIRDTASMAVDYTYLDPVVNNVKHINDRSALFLVNFVDTRADFLNATSLLDEAALDHYTFTREAYLQRREYYVYDGDPPMDDFEEME